MDIEQNLALFQELLCCGNSIYTWRYDADGNLLSSNCPEESLFGKAFSLLGCLKKALQLGKDGSQPQVVGTAMGLIWGVDFVYREDALERMYVIGPAFSYSISMQDMENGFRHYAGQEISLAWKHRLISACRKIPIAQNILFLRYLLMLHYCLTGEKLEASDTFVQQSFADAIPAPARRNRQHVWQAERALLDMVRSGNLNYKEALNTSLLISAGIPVMGRDPLRHILWETPISSQRRTPAPMMRSTRSPCSCMMTSSTECIRSAKPPGSPLLSRSAGIISRCIRRKKSGPKIWQTWRAPISPFRSCPTVSVSAAAIISAECFRR